MIKANFHTHTHRCNHATGTVSNYAAAAEKEKVKILGMSDHTPLPDNDWPHIRMDMTELEDYETEISSAKDAYPDIIILKGLECDWKPEYYNFYKEELLEQRGYDYLIGALHWFPFHGDWISVYDINKASHLAAYSRFLIEAMQSDLFLFIAHPDVFGAGYGKWDNNTHACSKDILQAAEALSIPLEINGYGFRKNTITTKTERCYPYPIKEFWESAASYSVSGVCNSDAHAPEDVYASIDQAIALAETHRIPILNNSIYLNSSDSLVYSNSLLNSLMNSMNR